MDIALLWENSYFDENLGKIAVVMKWVHVIAQRAFGIFPSWF